MNDREKLTEAFWKTYDGQKVSACLGSDSIYFDLNGPTGAFHVSMKTVCNEGDEFFSRIKNTQTFIMVYLTKRRGSAFCHVSLYPDQDLYQDCESFYLDFDLKGKLYNDK